jgi:PKD repeat protein
MKHYLVLAILCICISAKTNAQTILSSFQDTATRYGSTLQNSVRDGSYVYFCGSGVGIAPQMPSLIKIDSTGREVWNAYKDSALAFQGTFRTVFVDSFYVYVFGTNNQTPAPYFLAKFDKNNGSLIYLKKQISQNVEGIIQIKDIGDSFRMVLYTANPGYSPSNITPINVLTLNKASGNFSSAQPFGLSQYPPLYIDDNDNVYYKLGDDSLMKYSSKMATVAWKSKVRFGMVGNYPVRTVTKQNNITYSAGSVFATAVNDSTGEVIWNQQLARGSYNPTDIQLLNDSLYISWNTEVTGDGISFSMFAKINKNTGQVYLFGSPTFYGGIEKDSVGAYRETKTLIDNKGDIYFFGGHYDDVGYLGGDSHSIRKISGTNGKLIYDYFFPTDGLTRWFNDMSLSDYYATNNPGFFLFDNKPSALFQNHINDVSNYINQSHVLYVRMQDQNNPVVQSQFYYDNKIYQFPSTVVSVKYFGNNAFVLKQQGEDVLLEKYANGTDLVWQKKIMPQRSSLAQGFAIDSTGKIGVFLADNYQGFSVTPTTLTSFFNIYKVGIFSPDGDSLAMITPSSSTWSSGNVYEMMGAENGFYLFNAGSFTYFDTNGYQQYTYGATSLAASIYQPGFNKFSHLVNTQDSIYVFSSRTDNAGNPFFIAINKVYHGTTRVSLDKSFSNGYVLCAAKSAASPSCAYLSGVNGNGALAVLVKYDLAARKEIWSYQTTNQGEVFKVVEDNKGNVYGLEKDAGWGLKVIKFNGTNGSIIWTENQSISWDTQCIDMDLNVQSGLVTVTILKTDTNNKANVYTSILQISSTSGKLYKTSDIRTSIGSSYIQAVKSANSANTLIGGNKGEEGFLSLYSDVDPDKCNTVADFTANADPTNPLVFNFVNNSTVGTGATYLWKFGDGSSSVTTNPNYTYKTAGNYNVSLNVNDARGCQDSIVKVVTVNCNVVADFSVKADSKNPLTVTFTNQSTGSGNFVYSWKFGDGDSSIQKDVTHTYKTGGNYPVSMNVKQTNGCQDALVKIVTVTAPVNIDSTGNTAQNDSTSISVIPNPVHNAMKLFINAKNAGPFTINITDMSGTIVKRIIVNASRGPNYFTITVDDLRPGIYLLSAYGSSQTEKIRFLRVN